MSTLAVTINYNCHYGFVEYDEITKKVAVHLNVAEARAAVEKFLATPMTLDAPLGESIRDFVTTTVEPLASAKAFQLAMTRLWGKTGVRVEWSMPSGMAEKLAPVVD